MTIYLDEMPNIWEGVNCFKTSDPTGEENCIAHACGGARGMVATVTSLFLATWPAVLQRQD